MDELLAAAEKHREEDRLRAETIKAARRFAEALAADIDPSRREVAKELAEIVGKEEL